MRVFISFFALGAALASGQSLQVQVSGLTPQQAILSITTDGSGGCTVQAYSDAAMTELVHDVDESLFPGSSKCDRPGSIVNQKAVTFILGFRGTATASNGDIYSRSLQADAPVYYRVSLASGASVTGSFTTIDPPLGNSAPDYIPWNESAFGHYGWPTQHFATKPTGEVSIDPLTGLQLTRLTGPGMSGYSLDHTTVVPERDFSGGRWSLGCLTNNSRFPASQQTDSYCTYTGPGGPQDALFLQFDYTGEDDATAAYNGPNLPGVMRYAPSGFTLSTNGYGDSATVCATDDGMTCADAKAPYLTIPYPATDHEIIDPAANEPNLEAWGSPNLNSIAGAHGGGLYTGSVQISGAEITITGGDHLPTPIMKPGMTIGLFNGDYTSYHNYQIASVHDARHFTLTEPVAQAYSDPHYQLSLFGLLIWKNPGGTGSVHIGSMGVGIYRDKLFTGANEASDWTDSCHGEVQTTDNHGQMNTAKLCQTGSGQGAAKFLWFPSNNDERVYDLSGSSGGLHYSGGYIGSCTYDGSYAAVDPFSGGQLNPHYQCSYPSSGNTVLQDIQASYPNIDLTYWLGGGSALTERDMGTNGPYYLFNAVNGSAQNVGYWTFEVDTRQHPGGSGRVVNASNSFDTYPLRFSVTHDGSGPFDDGTGGQQNVHDSVPFGMNMATRPMIGEYSMQVSKVYGTGAGDTSVPASYAESCAADGVLNPIAIAMEPSDQSCYRVEVATEPVNEFPPTGPWNGQYPQGDLTPFAKPQYAGSRPGPWAHNSTSCPGGAGDNTTSHCRSHLVDSAEGDWLLVGTQDPNFSYSNQENGGSYLWQSGEIDAIGKKTVSNGVIHLVLIRNPKDYFGRTGANGRSRLVNIPNGFLLQETTPSVTDMMFAMGSQRTITTPFYANKLTGAHNIEWTDPHGKDIYVEAGVSDNQVPGMGTCCTGHGVRIGQFPGVLSQDFNFSQQTIYPFDETLKAGNAPGDDYAWLGMATVDELLYQQEHPGGGTYAAPDRESRWALDGSPYAGASGFAGELWNQQYTLISGQQNTYLIAPSTANAVAKYGMVPEPKRRQTHVWAGPFLLKNISGPGSQISDATPFSYCHTGLADECVTGSQPGDNYVSVPAADVSRGCVNDFLSLTPCMTPAAPHMAYGYQFGIAKFDQYATHWRKLSMLYSGPGRENNYWNLIGDPEGDYAYGVGQDMQGYRTDLFAIKLPPWPNQDSIARNTFVPVQVKLSPVAGSTVEARWGYAEYGLDTNRQPLYCSAERNEDCTTIIPASSPQDPFGYPSEVAGQPWQDCSNGCTVTIPAVSGRVLYYAIDRKVNGVVTTSSVQTVAVK